jgi:aminoglycoside phosphotransferase (APT) family kinase protein
MPVAEVGIDESLVRALLHDQHRDLAGLLITPLANGWDNAMFRLGDHLTVRLPRRAVAAQLLVNEQRWLPSLSSRISIPTSAPVRCGTPTIGYPWHWSVLPWLPGSIAATTELDPIAVVEQLAQFWSQLHRPAHHAMPHNRFRGVPLAQRDASFRERLPTVTESIDIDRALARWETLSAAGPWTGPPVAVHGDLHAANVLVANRRISAIIDFGDVCQGDPACDLAISWMLLAGEDRARLRSITTAEESTWQRAEAWALAFCVIYLATSANNPVMHAIGTTLARELQVNRRVD